MRLATFCPTLRKCTFAWTIGEHHSCPLPSFSCTWSIPRKGAIYLSIVSMSSHGTRYLITGKVLKKLPRPVIDILWKLIFSSFRNAIFQNFTRTFFIAHWSRMKSFCSEIICIEILSKDTLMDLVLCKKAKKPLLFNHVFQGFSSFSFVTFS